MESKEKWYKSWKGWVSAVVTILFFILDAPGRIQQALIYRQQIPDFVKGTFSYWLLICGFLSLSLTILFFWLNGRNPSARIEEAKEKSADREKEIEAILADSDYRMERRTIKNADGSITLEISH